MLADALRRGIIEKRDKYEHAVRALIVKGVKRGEFAPCDAALVNDQRALHGVTPIHPLDPSRPAWRDVLVVTYRRRPAAQS